MKRRLAPGVHGSASFYTNVDGVRICRYRLDRWWDERLILDDRTGHPSDDDYRPLVCIGMNPSDACGEWDDNTSAKMTTYAKRERANGLVMVNAHPGIETDSKLLGNVLLPYGATDTNWEFVDRALCENGVAFVAMWGKRPGGISRESWRGRIAKIRDIVHDVGRELVCFGMNGDGSPRHPLYLPNAEPLVPFTWGAA